MSVVRLKVKMNHKTFNHRFKLKKNEVSKTNLGIDTFQYLISIQSSGIDTSSRYQFRYRNQGNDTGSDNNDT